MSKILREYGIVIPEGEDTPVVRQLIDLIEQLTAKIHQLEGLPPLPVRPKPEPSPLKNDDAPPSQQHNDGKKNSGRTGKKKPIRRGRPGRAKFKDLKIDQTIEIQPEAVPDGARRIGFKKFIQQELRLEVVNICYRRACYELPDGSTWIVPRPEHLGGQYGPRLRCYVFQQYFQSQVTQPLILQQLRELGVQISNGQVSRMLTENNQAFEDEKNSLLPAARQCSQFFQADDTTARHLGKNAHTLHIGNDFFASFFTTNSKSRLNFLNILREPYTDYVFGEEALAYLEYYGFPKKLHAKLTQIVNYNTKTFENQKAWERQLNRWKIVNPDHRRLMTEAALWGSLLAHGLYQDQPFIGDDAPQFKLLGFAHGLCWLHAERRVARLIPLTARQQRAYDAVRDQIWSYYQRLKAYRETPSEPLAAELSAQFDDLFLSKTGWRALNEALNSIHAKKAELLLVLEHPALPLHNNLSENDIRQFAKMRKISGSTRSENGRRARDTLISLKTTCRKLGISFWGYLQDRIYGLKQIRPLGELIIEAAQARVNA